MGEWTDPCIRDSDGAHSFVPLPPEPKRYIGNRWLAAICSKCGVYR